jgi:hypothetical protein
MDMDIDVDVVAPAGGRPPSRRRRSPSRKGPKGPAGGQAKAKAVKKGAAKAVKKGGSRRAPVVAQQGRRNGKWLCAEAGCETQVGAWVAFGVGGDGGVSWGGKALEWGGAFHARVFAAPQLDSMLLLCRPCRS